MIYTCKDCQKEFDSQWGISSHARQKHNLTSEEVYILYQLNGIIPLCACGCKEKPKFLGSNEGFRKYKLGHASRINNNWGHNLEAQIKSKETQRKMYASGELVVWNKGLDNSDPRIKQGTEKMMAHPERNKKISKALMGRKLSNKTKRKLSKIQHKVWTKEKREAQAHKRMLWMKENDYTKKSKTEETFLDIIDSLDLNPIRQFYVREIKAYYDFYIPFKNLLVEIDGDFWHCNPNTKHAIPKYASQKKNLARDKQKNEWCKQNKIPLIRFWESEINENPDEVKRRLMEYLS